VCTSVSECVNKWQSLGTFTFKEMANILMRDLHGTAGLRAFDSHVPFAFHFLGLMRHFERERDDEEGERKEGREDGSRCVCQYV